VQDPYRTPPRHSTFNEGGGGSELVIFESRAPHYRGTSLLTRTPPNSIPLTTYPPLRVDFLPPPLTAFLSCQHLSSTHHPLDLSPSYTFIPHPLHLPAMCLVLPLPHPLTLCVGRCPHLVQPLDLPFCLHVTFPCHITFAPLHLSAHVLSPTLSQSPFCHCVFPHGRPSPRRVLISSTFVHLPVFLCKHPTNHRQQRRVRHVFQVQVLTLPTQISMK
jgi:hypothetical protein